MPTNRTRRRRPQIEPDVIEALKSGAPIEWSPENHLAMSGARYFGDYDLTEADRARAGELLASWREQQRTRG